MRVAPPVMLFAAGRGRRMAPLTDDRPKPMVEVAGRPLVDYALDLLREADPRKIVANTHYLPRTLEAHLKSAGIETIHEPTLLETGGGLRNALPMLGNGPVMTLNTDAVWHGTNPVMPLIDTWQPDKMDALLTLVSTKSAIGHVGVGDFTLADDGQIIRGPDLVFTGLQIMKPGRLHEISEDVFSLNKVWDLMAADKRLFGVVYDGVWCDVGRPESIPLAEAVLNV